MDEYQLVSQGEVFYVTELMTKLEGLERGPAGNTSLTAAVTLARLMDRDQIVVVQETEYTGCLLYTSDAADERSSVDLGGRRIIQKKYTTAACGRSHGNKAVHVWKIDL